MNIECDKWVDKYRPEKISEMVLTDELKNFFNNIVKTKKYINMTLIGSPGIGKTTIAKALAKEADAEVLFLNCASGDGKIEAIQTKVLPFVQSLPFDDKPMFVIFDELDSASSSGDSNFQKALRNVIEGSPNVVFIATANYNKIIPAVLSRCPEIKLSFNPKDLLVRIKEILDSEHVEYTSDNLKEFVKVTVKKFYPDIRLIVNHLQASCSTGKLIVSKSAIIDEEKTSFIEDIVNKCKEANNILDVRRFYIQNKEKIDDYKIMASNLFNYVVDNNIVTNPNDILKLSTMYYQINVVVDPEIQFFAMLTLIHSNINS